jgi:MoxR-like ATPase
VDEFNRIPTKTQSGLLTAVAEQYVELFNSYFAMEDAPWFFTANEANGGGTYQVIAALWDRMDASVRATPVNAHSLEKARGIDNKAPFPEHLT